jgi:signal transduction histidine kinase
VIPKTQRERVNLKIHPRVFAALGADLVTSDFVAIIELVKNAYDANAKRVSVRFRYDAAGQSYMEIEDDGIGMTHQTINDAWCVIATPYKTEHTHIGKGKRQRRVSGEKGLGRLSAARLGSKLILVTQANNEPCYELRVDWDELAEQTDLNACAVELEQVTPSPFKQSGTTLRIENLRSDWAEETLADLEENLARLLSPFASKDEFSIAIDVEKSDQSHELKIEPPGFLSHPKYRITGTVDIAGNISCEYTYSFEEAKRIVSLSYTWDQVQEAAERRDRGRKTTASSESGPFAFEIRAWDIGVEDIKSIESRFEYKGNVRKAIAAHKGLSVYRDHVLVLPKSETAKDWLGLDLRRVSKTGTRLSTSQIVGYVSIAADSNPQLADTSDRERLVDNSATKDFKDLLVYIVSILEGQRDADRLRPAIALESRNLFASLSADKLVDEIEVRANEGASVADVLPSIQEFRDSLGESRKELEERFVYYSRLATVGTIAHMLVHEIRNRTMVIGAFLQEASSRFGPFKDKVLSTAYTSAVSSLDTLERLADTFSPLASRTFRRRLKKTVVEERIRECCTIMSSELEKKKIRIQLPRTTTHVGVDPGEFDTILLNVMTNAAYWLTQVVDDSRVIEFHIGKAKQTGRIEVAVHDSGPGVSPDDAERVFWPGVTKKPGGIGMGLTVAAELVSDYAGKMWLQQPGKLGGASFFFDLPLNQ